MGGGSFCFVGWRGGGGDVGCGAVLRGGVGDDATGGRNPTWGNQRREADTENSPQRCSEVGDGMGKM